MGFSGGGSNVLKPHKHNSLVLQDGGNLDFKNDTQSDMSSGSVTYSNGSHLQELVKPVTPANEVLTFATSATAPSWVSLGLHVGRLEQLAHHESTGNEASAVLTFSEINLDDYAALYLSFTGVTVAAFDLEMIVGAVTSGYRYCYDQSALGTWTNVQAMSQTEIKLCDSGLLSTDNLWFNGHVWIYPAEGVDGADNYNVQYQVNSPVTGNSLGGATTAGSHDFAITSITMQTSTSYWGNHARFNLMGLKRAT